MEKRFLEYFKSEKIGLSNDIRVLLPVSKNPINLMDSGAIGTELVDAILFYIIRYNIKKYAIDCSDLLKDEHFIKFNELRNNNDTPQLQMFEEFIARCKCINNSSYALCEIGNRGSNTFIEEYRSAGYKHEGWILPFIRMNLDDEELISFLQEGVNSKVLKADVKEDRDASYAIANTVTIFSLSLSALSKTFEDNKVFVICEFNEKNKKTNTDIIEPLITKWGLKPIVMYNDHLHGNIDIAIKQFIKTSKFVIANISYSKNWNPNVFYEIGMANAFDKNVIIVLDQANNKENNGKMNLPFDINSHTCITLDEDGNNETLDKAIESLS